MITPGRQFSACHRMGPRRGLRSGIPSIVAGVAGRARPHHIYSQFVRGHVDSITRGISVPNVQPNSVGLASVNPIFIWVRLAQRIPVHIKIDQVPDGVRLVSGTTATVQIDPKPKP